MNLPLNARRSRSDVVATSPRGNRRGFQIGPRIRIGGSIGKVGQNIKNTVTKAATDTGHVVGEAASNPWVQGLTAAALTATGVGAPAAAAIMAAERGGGALLKKGGNLGDGIKGGVEGAAMGYGAAKLGSAVRQGIGAISQDGVTGAIKTGVGKLGGLVTGGGSDGQGNFGTVGDMLGKAQGALGGGGGGGGTGLDKALMVAMIADAAATKKRQQELQDKGLGYATDAYAAKQPLRQQGLSALQAPARPDLSGIFQNTANPYTAGKTQPAPLAQKAPVLPTGGTY